MNYQKALLYLDRFINYEKVFAYNYKRAYKLDRVGELLSLLDNPQEYYNCILIAGTKGKGSTAALLASILNNSGLKTALYTSPHLVSVRERIQLNSVPISEKDFSNLLGLIRKKIELYRLKNITFFEILTALAFLYFKQKTADIAVLEVGLGGRLDATNVIKPLVSIITPIDYDHTYILGKSLKKIAKEKCGIIKKDSCVVSAPQPKVVKSVIKKIAQQQNSRILFVGKAISPKNIKISLSGTAFDCKLPNKKFKSLYTSLIGRHQAINSAVALGVVDILNSRFGFNIKERGIRGGLRNVKLSGRFQIISTNPLTIADGAHNRISAQTLKNTYKELFPCIKPIIIFGISSDKDIDRVGKQICPIAKQMIFTKSASSRAAEPSLLADRLARFCRDHYVTYSVDDAIIFAKRIAGKEDIILITGSLFVVADALKTKAGNSLS